MFLNLESELNGIYRAKYPLSTRKITRFQRNLRLLRDP